jgi:large subunit ribosomal protein L10
MNREQKNQAISDLAEELNGADVLYLADIAGLNAEDSTKLRRLCHKQSISLKVVKNTLLRKAMEKVEEKNFEELYGSLKGNTSMMISEVGNAPAKLIKEFRKKNEKPILKAAWIDSSVYVGDDQVESLANLKSKAELIGEVITLLQSPAKNVISGLQSGKSTLAGLVKTLSERND